MSRSVALFVGLCIVSSPCWSAPLPTKKTDVVEDRKAFVPYRRYFPLEDKVVGILVSDVRAMMGQEGRSGPPIAMAFSAKAGSYRWMYVPTEANAIISKLRVPIGKSGAKFKTYAKLNMANAEEVKRWNVTVPYSLVEVEVNDGEGSPAIEGFVATKVRRLDGTKEYPFQVTHVVEEMRKNYAQHLTDTEKEIAAKMADARRDAIGKAKATGPRTTETLMYVTWLPEKSRLRIHFRTTITDGKYELRKQGIGRPRPLPVPLPPAPQPLPIRRVQEQPIAFPPPPPREVRVRVGTSFGIEFGVGYEVSPVGKLERRLVLPYKLFKKERALPAQLRFPNDPVLP